MNSAFEVVRRSGRGAGDRLLELVGGRARLRVVLVLAGVLGLDGADAGTVSAAAGNLRRTFDVGNTQIGFLVSMVYVAGALATVPVGVLTDRFRRTRLLAISVALWSVAMLASGAAQDYLWLVLSRVALGAVTATAGPTIASLTGDYFPVVSRARMWSLILGGELAGTGIGFVVSGELAALISWRYAFWWLMIPGALLVWQVVKLPEPARGGQTRLRLGQRQVIGEADADRMDTGEPSADELEDQHDDQEGPQQMAEEAMAHDDITPRSSVIIRSDPTTWSIWRAVRYVVDVRTNLVIIIGSALGYFFFAGVRSFALIFVTGHYDIRQSVASVLVLVIGAGALAGVFFSGRLADRLLSRGHITARVLIPTVVLFVAPLAFAPGIYFSSIAAAIPLMTVGAAALGAAMPPLDAARLDIIHPQLWGRAEGIRTLLRTGAQAAAPTILGFLSESAFGGGSSGLRNTFLLCLIALVAAGLLAMVALRTYPRDVAAAAESYSGTEPDTARTGG